MEEADVINPSKPLVVDPEVRSYVYGLVTALGGSANDEEGRYVPGDDALGCLRDLKKWLRFYDDKLNRLDVARCLGEANLVNGDLVPILALYGDCSTEDKHKARINLACLELLVPLTWPVEAHSQMTVNHHKHTPYLQYAQLSYKRGLLTSLLTPDATPILRAIIRIGLPSMSVPRSERSTRDEGILKIMLYLFRNLAVISALPYLAVEGVADQTSRSATINAFHHQDVFALLLTMCSNMGEEFSFQDVIIVEILFHLVKGVDVWTLFMDASQQSATRTDELQDLLGREDQMTRDYAETAPTRHGRFGTMIWVKRDDGKLSTVSGQDVLKGNRSTYLKMDKSKKWNKPKQNREPFDLQSHNINLQVNLTTAASGHLRTFVEEFLDSGFNPLFTHLRKAIEREAERLTEATSRQFFFVVSWFLQAERARRARQRERSEQQQGASRSLDPDSFGLVASVLNQETFVALNRYMQTCLDYKDWPELSIAMQCFTQILLTVREMSQSSLDEDQEIAENIQNRIFYEETTHDRILMILRNYKTQGFVYLNACTELAHVFLRMLEQYSKQNADMQVRSRRRKRRKNRDEDSQNRDTAAENEEDGSEAEDMAEANRTTVERSFDFKRFSAKFCTQKSVDTFVALTRYYRELDSEQLKRVHRFFYRVAFKQDLSVLLFRMDIISLLYKMIKGPEPLDASKPSYREWEELTQHIIKKLTRKIEQRPVLITELLFSKIPATLYYLEYGHEKQTVFSESKSRPAAELEVKPNATTTTNGRLQIVVAALVLDNNEGLVRWVVQSLESGAMERKAWEAEAEARQSASADGGTITTSTAPSIAMVPDEERCRMAMYKNGQLRLLMTLSGFELLGDDALGGSWIIPSSISSQKLEEIRGLIQEHLDNPVNEIEGVEPRGLLRRKHAKNTSTSNETAAPDIDFGNDSEGEDNPDAILFPPNGRSKHDALSALKQKRRKKGKAKDGSETDDQGLDEETIEARRLARKNNALARQRKIKSDLYVHASDEDNDDEANMEFFAREEERRRAQANRIREALTTGVADNSNEPNTNRNGQSRKRKSVHDQSAQRKRQQSATPSAENEDHDEPLIDTTSTPPPGTRSFMTPPTPAEDDIVPGSSLNRSPATPSYWPEEFDKGQTRPGNDGSNGSTGENDEGDDEDDILPARSIRRPRVMGGSVVDSDSD